MLWTIIRTIIYILIAASTWLGVQFYIAKDLKDAMYTPPEKYLFVDQAVAQGSYKEELYDERFSQTQKALLRKFSPIEQIYNGTPLFPFTTIQDALDKMDESNIRMVKISNGIYEEILTLPENTALIGSGDTVIHSDPLLAEKTITVNNNTSLVNLTVSGGKHTIFIPYNISALFDRVIVSGAKDFGVKMESKNRPDTPEGEEEPVIYEYYEKTEKELSQMPLLKFTNCTITKSGNQGMYLRDGRVEIHNSQIIENGEEGIDLHPHMHVIITNTESSRNGESGLETEVYDNTVIIKNSIFDQNIKNGIALITSHGLGKIIIEKNTITNNARFGIRCAVHKTKPESPRPFFQYVTTEIDNVFENNMEGNHASDCYDF